MPSRSRTLEWAFLGLFALSGACGLIHELVWVRRLTFVFGGTTLAVTTVLACFMAGLAAGSGLAGRLAGRIRNPLQLYGFLEIAVGIFCGAVPLLLDLLAPLYARLAGVAGGSFAVLVAARAATSLAVLGIPAGLMGATLPVLVQAFAGNAARTTGSIVARFYGINTLGAFAGSAAAGLWLLPTFGFSVTLLTGALLNVFAGVAALALARAARFPADPADSDGADRPSAGNADAARPAIRLGSRSLLASYALAGAAAMACQVVWTRALVLVLGPSTYAFSLVASCFILGLALGSLFIGPFVRRVRDPLKAAAILQGAIALAGVLVLPLFMRLTDLVMHLAGPGGPSFESLFATEAVAVFGLLLVPTLCMGATLPLICAAVMAARRTESGGHAPARAASAAGTGAVYAANTLGCIIGVCATGFWLIPWIGNLQRAMLLVAGVFGLLAAVYALGAGWRSRRTVSACIAGLWIAGLAVAALQAPWSRMALMGGPYLGRGLCESEEIIFYRDGVDASVTVTTLNQKDLVLRINGKPDASTEIQDMYTQVMLGGIPMLLKPDARSVFVLGLGSGITPAAVLAHGAEHVDVAEISGAVVRAADLFKAHNGDVLKDPRVRLHADDGRNFLQRPGGARYDVIICEPSNPWVSGMASLFSREFFEIARSRLSPGGLHGQWVHSYSMSPDDFASILATFSSVFPHVQVWSMSFGDYLFLGSDAPIVLPLRRMEQAFEIPAVKEMYRGIRITDVRQIANHYVTEGGLLAAWLRGRRMLTDDRPHLEYSAPRYLLKNDSLIINAVLFGSATEPAIAADAEPAAREEFLRRVAQARQTREFLRDSVDAARARDLRRFLDDMLAAVRASPDDGRVLALVSVTVATRYQSADPGAKKLIEEYRRRLLAAAPLLRTIQ